MIRDFRIENHLFSPHLRNGSYGAFFEQATEYSIDMTDTATVASSLWHIDAIAISHPILELESQVSTVLATMEVHGVYIDKNILDALEQELSKAIQNIESKVASQTGDNSVNLASPLQLQKLLFEVMWIKPLKKTKTGWSVDEETLTILAEEHEICREILTHRHASKLLGTYVRWLTKYINPTTHRIHTSYDTLWASTGRMSSNDPNLQNIPAGDPWSDEIKKAFRPQQNNWSYVVADYSQIEIRILACLSGDEKMLSTLKENKDLHMETAKVLFEREDISKTERSMAKTVNFGVMYGITPFGLSKMLGKAPVECAIYIDRFFWLYPATREYFDHVISETLKVGYAETFFGRRRTIKGLSDKNSIVREQAKREAMNMPIQGTCADILKYAMIKIASELKKQKLEAQLLMQVHDELVVECPDTETETVTKILHEVMEHIVEWDIPMAVEVGVGKNWLEAKK
jgi:DNA polymerase I